LLAVQFYVNGLACDSLLQAAEKGFVKSDIEILVEQLRKLFEIRCRASTKRRIQKRRILKLIEIPAGISLFGSTLPELILT
jgi:hypothetical protein